MRSGASDDQTVKERLLPPPINPLSNAKIEHCGPPEASSIDVRPVPLSVLLSLKSLQNTEAPLGANSLGERVG